MKWERLTQVEWLSWSGLPAALNEVRQGGWTVFFTLVQLETRTNPLPDAVEISPNDLSEKCGIPIDKIEKICLALQKKKVAVLSRAS